MRKKRLVRTTIIPGFIAALLILFISKLLKKIERRPEENAEREIPAPVPETEPILPNEPVERPITPTDPNSPMESDPLTPEDPDAFGDLDRPYRF